MSYQYDRVSFGHPGPLDRSPRIAERRLSSPRGALYAESGPLPSLHHCRQDRGGRTSHSQRARSAGLHAWCPLAWQQEVVYRQSSSAAALACHLLVTIGRSLTLAPSSCPPQHVTTQMCWRCWSPARSWGCQQSLRCGDGSQQVNQSQSAHSKHLVKDARSMLGCRTNTTPVTGSSAADCESN